MIFGYTEEQLTACKGIFTAEEIAQQPDTWRKTINQVAEVWEPLQAFIAKASGGDIILTGAGTSEYVGNSLCPALLQQQEVRIHAIGTTDIVATPEAYISPKRKTLLVSFARSGNSPESVGAVKAAERVSDKVSHLFITCNPEGELAKLAAEKDNCFSIVLTPETHDRSFAMTSSFSNMYIAALLALEGCKGKDLEAAVDAAEKFIKEDFPVLREFIDKEDFNRIVYLGSDVLKGIAQESALKVLELTAGKAVALFDTPMGFRHGPKSVVDDNTVCVVFLSDYPWTRKYEMDVLKELYRDKKGSRLIAVTTDAVEGDEPQDYCDLLITMKTKKAGSPNCILAPAYVTVAQSLAMMYSLRLGITPDNPCPTGEVNRVVQGVTIYE